MDSGILASLVLAQVVVLPVSYVLWTALKSSLLAFAIDRPYARSHQGPRVGTFRERYLFVLIWLTLTAGLMALVS
jgi:hypothetical protein